MLRKSLSVNANNLYEKRGQDSLAAFMYALRAPETKRQWPGRLKIFLDYVCPDKQTLREKAEDFIQKSRQYHEWAQENLMKFIAYQHQRAIIGDISETTIANYYKAAKLFCEMNDLVLNWKKITRGLPRGRRAANDRAPTLEEIQRLVEYPDRRIKPIVYTMSSSGIRIGAWDYLQWKHVLPITNDNGEIIAARLLVYGGDPEEYYSFITPEAFNSLQNWMDFRASYGENISGKSWVMRDIWQTTNITYGSNLGLATCPIKLKSSGIKRLLERALWDQGLRHPLSKGVRRHEWKAAHGFRKYYKSHAEQVMKPINVEITMGHDIGLSESYYKPTEQEVMQDYLKAVDNLTINGDKTVLKKQVERIKQETRDNEYIIKGKLQEKDEEIRSMKEDLSSMRSQMNDVLEVLKIAKSKNGMIGKDRTMLDENRRITFGYVDNNNQIVEVKIPLDGVEVDEVHAGSTTE
jgi:integrase